MSYYFCTTHIYLAGLKEKTLTGNIPEKSVAKNENKKPHRWLQDTASSSQYRMVKNGKNSKQLYEKKMAPEMIHLALRIIKHTYICIQICEIPFRTIGLI